MTESVSPVRPSQLHQLLQCPGSLSMQLKYPQLGDTTAADEGTAAHWAMWKYLTPGEPTPKVGDIAPNGIVLTDEMIDSAWYIFDDVVSTLGPNWAQVVQVEQPVTMNTLYPGMWGTPDVRAQLTPRLRYTWDLKHGHNQVEVFENPQLVAYGTDDARPKDPNMVHVFKIVQPRSFHRDGIIREWRVFDKDLETMRCDISKAAYTARGPNPPLLTGPACENCDARHVCPALQTRAYQSCETAGKAQPVEMSPLALGIELRILWDALDRLKARISGLEASAEDQIRKGVRVPLVDLTAGRGSTEWSMPDAQIVEIAKMLGVDVARPLKAVTPNQAKKAGLNPDLIAAYTSTTPGALRLTPENLTQARKVFGPQPPSLL